MIQNKHPARRFEPTGNKGVSPGKGVIKVKAQAVSKTSTKIERLMEENRKIRSQVKKLISTFQG